MNWPSTVIMPATACIHSNKFPASSLAACFTPVYWYHGLNKSSTSITVIAFGAAGDVVWGQVAEPGLGIKGYWEDPDRRAEMEFDAQVDFPWCFLFLHFLMGFWEGEASEIIANVAQMDLACWAISTVPLHIWDVNQSFVQSLIAFFFCFILKSLLVIEAVNWEAGHPVCYFWIRKGIRAPLFKVQGLGTASGSATGSLWSQASPLTWNSLSSHESGVKLVFTTSTEATEVSRLIVIKLYSSYPFFKQEEIFWNVSFHMVSLGRRAKMPMPGIDTREWLH